jgi:RING-variant domain
MKFNGILRVFYGFCIEKLYVASILGRPKHAMTKLFFFSVERVGCKILRLMEFVQISGDEAVRLYLQVHKSALTGVESPEIQVDRQPSCRICKGNSEQVITVPCGCRGSLKFAHLRCLRRWIHYARTNVCEICHQPYRFQPPGNTSAVLLKEFFTSFYVGRIARYLLNFVILSHILWVNTQQLSQVIDSLNLTSPEPRPSIALLPSIVFLLALYYFLYLDWTWVTVVHIGAILRDWWRNAWMNPSIRQMDSTFFDTEPSNSDDDANDDVEMW